MAHKHVLAQLLPYPDTAAPPRPAPGDADAYGVIADCYTDLGEYEKAAQFYDRYIDTMNREGPSVL